MDPIPPEAYLAAFPEPIHAIGNRLRALVLETIPEAAMRLGLIG